MTAPVGFRGAVLTGGRSRRMGRDKALLEIDGQPLAVRTTQVLQMAGARDTVCIGGDGEALAALGLRWHADLYPGEGPLGGILTALRAVSADVVVVVATDLVGLTPDTVRAVVAGLTPDADVALADSGRLEPLCGAWRRRAEPVITKSFVAGERAIHAALGDLVVVTVPVDAATLCNVNTPDDL